MVRNGVLHLRNKIEILYRYKWIVLLVPVISLLTAGVIIAKAKSKPVCEVYEAIAIIQDGFVKGALIKKKKGWEQFKFNAGDMIGRVKFEDIKDTSYFKLKLLGNNEEQVKEACEKISKDYISEVKVLYDRKYKIYTDQKSMAEKNKEFYDENIHMVLESKEARIELLNQQKEIYENNIAELEAAIVEVPEISGIEKAEIAKQVSFCRNQINAAKIKVLMIERQIYDENANCQSSIAGVRLKILECEQALLNINIILSQAKEFAIVRPIEVTRVLYRPRIKINNKQKLLLALVFGLFGGIALVFIIENWKAETKGKQ